MMNKVRERRRRTTSNAGHNCSTYARVVIDFER